MKKIFNFFGYAIALHFALAVLIGIFRMTSSQHSDCGETSFDDKISGERNHTRNWRLTSTRDEYCAQYLTNNELNTKHHKARKGLSQQNLDYTNYWGSVYDQLVSQSSGDIDYIVDSLRQISATKNLNALAFAELMVSFVQDIPYSFVMREGCEGKSKPCIANQAFGILSPYEFLHTLSGDCDTRAVLLFAMLENAGYIPMIVISDKYAHAMLALQIPTSGDYITYKNQKFYFWETTAIGWLPGMLPPQNNNINYWQIALVHER